MQVDGNLAKSRRASFLNPLIVPSTEEASARGMSLALIRPIRPEFKIRAKRPEIIEAERQAYRHAARQMSMLDKDLEAFEPTPYAFAFKYEDHAGKHIMQCGDWETSATFWRFNKEYGEKHALDVLFETFNREYPRKGMAFAMGTVKKRPKQWMLLGVIRLDETLQTSLPF